jgi:hypothetical protein
VNPSYFNSYENLAMERTDSGTLPVRLHTDGGPIVFTGQAHRDLPRALAEIGEDRENKVVILTGTGEMFMDANTSAAGVAGSTLLSTRRSSSTCGTGASFASRGTWTVP